MWSVHEGTQIRTCTHARDARCTRTRSRTHTHVSHVYEKETPCNFKTPLRSIVDGTADESFPRRTHVLNYPFRSQSVVQLLVAIMKEVQIDEPFTVADVYALQIHTVRANEVVVVVPDETLVAYVLAPLALASLTRTEERFVARCARPRNVPI